MITAASPGSPSFAAQVQWRTDRRIRNLAVDLRGSRLIVRGQAPSVHVVQLALQELIDRLPGGARIENRITVARNA